MVGPVGFEPTISGAFLQRHHQRPGFTAPKVGMLWYPLGGRVHFSPWTKLDDWGCSSIYRTIGPYLCLLLGHPRVSRKERASKRFSIETHNLTRVADSARQPVLGRNPLVQSF